MKKETKKKAYLLNQFAKSTSQLDKINKPSSENDPCLLSQTRVNTLPNYPNPIMNPPQVS